MRRKLTLAMDALRVESFVALHDDERPGSVLARQDGPTDLPGCFSGWPTCVRSCGPTNGQAICLEPRCTPICTE